MKLLHLPERDLFLERIDLNLMIMEEFSEEEDIYADLIYTKLLEAKLIYQWAYSSDEEEWLFSFTVNSLSPS